MNKLLNILALVGLTVACGPSRNLPEGAPERMRSKELRELVDEAANDYTSLRVRTVANFKQGESSQNFRLEARILRDSLIWLDIADPILGIKVARAILTKDSVAFYNKIDQEYVTGDVRKFQEEFRLNFGFEELQSILSANLIFPIQDGFDLYYRPGFYLFSDFNPDAQDNAEEYFSRESISQVFVEPSFYKPAEQIFNEPGKKRSYTVTHSGYSQKDRGFAYPQKIVIGYQEQEANELTLDIRAVDKDDPKLTFPFNIPSGYAEMR